MTASKYTLSLSTFFKILSLFTFLSAEFINGLTLELIHPHSPFNPLRDPSKTRYDWIREAYHHTRSRAAAIQSLGGDISKFKTDIKLAGGGYVMKYSVGTPPVETYGIADTGSDLTWTQCQPCINCYQQETAVFNPQNSQSYRTVTCDASECSLVEVAGCSDDNTCQYKVSYGDRSQTSGDLAVDILTIGGASFDNVVFGCGHQNNGTFSNAASGIIGLGSSQVSIIKQLDPLIGGKFAYCLSSRPDSPSHISFGPEAIVTGTNAVKTPIIKAVDQPSFYWLSLESISIGAKTFQVSKSTSTSDMSADGTMVGNIIIDSGTTLTMIPSDLFTSLVTALKGSIPAAPLDDPEGAFGLCYSTRESFEVPEIIVRFTGGADVKLSPKGTFVEVGAGISCLTIIPDTDIGISIFGNLSEIDYLFGYDLEEQTVTFKPSDCSTF
ncbi:unnamed protein product [Cuscuta epithymum]|uniref:Peptidase A1 domain-containing protein n=1 Tax=Cuscuta epithymum TaxID=186058 RepID=A0AAV0FQQ5_9ASTE|nr:unnamed protein product [Cuscuta epithymum]